MVGVKILSLPLTSKLTAANEYSNPPSRFAIVQVVVFSELMEVVGVDLKSVPLFPLYT
jgi:hypothetical protein